MKKILIVDDEPEFVNMVKIRLEAGYYEVITACSGKEGLKKAVDEHPDIILLDIIMPRMGGFEVLNRLKNIPQTRSTPVVMLTAKGETGAILKAEDLGSADYIIKPFEPQELLKLIKKYI